MKLNKILSFLFILFFTGLLQAYEISKIEFLDNSGDMIPNEMFISRIDIKPGVQFSEKAVSDAIKALYDTRKIKDVSAEVIATDYEGIIREGKELAALHDQIVVKVPMIKEGVKAIKYFSDHGIKTNCTLVFSAGQALLAAKAGATYVSPFIGRLDDISTDGLNLIAEIRLIYDNYGFETQILAASVRHTMHVLECAKIGSDVMTGPLSSIEGLLKHPLTDIGLEKFLADYKKGN